MKIVVIYSCCFAITLAFSSFRRRIPNGMNVPNPCDNGPSRAAAGHLNPAGGGPRNLFGQDFERIARGSWSPGFCQMDSDGDGKTNGEELGDPNCEWRRGSAPSERASGHPGICEPVDSAACKDQSPC